MVDNFCLSSFLAFRYITDPASEWIKGVKPEYPSVEEGDQIEVKTSDEIVKNLEEIVSREAKNQNNQLGMFLSEGIDSAIVASFLPKGSHAYTIRFMADGAINEAEGAFKYAEFCGLKFTEVKVYWEDYIQYSDLLMQRKKAPLHAIEVALFKAGLQAKQDGVKTIVVGNGADSTFGGMDKLLSKDWTFNEFINRYTFVDPAKVLKNPVDISCIYEPYRTDIGFNVQGFLKKVHGLGIIQTFDNAIHNAGLEILEPFEKLKLGLPLDIQRIRNGEPKYLLYEIFRKIYPGFNQPAKIPFARPMDQWLKDWKGPVNEEFIENLDISQFTGDQKWIIYCLDRFITLLKQNKI